MVAYSFKRRFIVPISLGLGIHCRVEDVVTDLETAAHGEGKFEGVVIRWGPLT